MLNSEVTLWLQVFSYALLAKQAGQSEEITQKLLALAGVDEELILLALMPTLQTRELDAEERALAAAAAIEAAPFPVTEGPDTFAERTALAEEARQIQRDKGGDLGEITDDLMLAYGEKKKADDALVLADGTRKLTAGEASREISRCVREGEQAHARRV